MLTQLTTLKARLGLDPTDTVDDAVLGNMLLHCSDRFEQECNRKFAYLTNTTCEFRADQLNINCDHAPIQSVSLFELKTTETEGWLEQDNIDYMLSPQRMMVELAAPLGTSRQLGRVTYTGGYILPGTAAVAPQLPLPDAIEQSCIEQVVYWYQRRNQLGLVSISGEGGSISQFRTLDLLPHVKSVLENNERHLY